MAAVCVARGKARIFVYIQPAETLKSFKEKLLEIINFKKHPELFGDSTVDKVYDDIQLRPVPDIIYEDDTQTMTDLKLFMKDIRTIYLLFKDANGDWEPMDVYDPEPEEPSKVILLRAKREQRAARKAKGLFVPTRIAGIDPTGVNSDSDEDPPMNILVEPPKGEGEE